MKKILSLLLVIFTFTTTTIHATKEYTSNYIPIPELEPQEERMRQILSLGQQMKRDQRKQREQLTKLTEQLTKLTKHQDRQQRQQREQREQLTQLTQHQDQQYGMLLQLVEQIQQLDAKNATLVQDVNKLLCTLVVGISIALYKFFSQFL